MRISFNRPAVARWIVIGVVALAGAWVWARAGVSPLAADVVSLIPAKDNTLIQWNDIVRSNGAGDIFVGRTNQDTGPVSSISGRRGLIDFDIADSIPANAIILSATLSLYDVQGNNGSQNVSLHVTLQDWGQGTSFQGGGQGAPATQNDATWLDTFYNAANPSASPTWTHPGGDFSPIVSATTLVTPSTAPGYNHWFSWSSTQMVADVQAWLDDPASNFGWTLIGNESVNQTAKRFASGEDGINPYPELVIDYEVPTPEPASLTLLASGGWLFLRRRAARSLAGV